MNQHLFLITKIHNKKLSLLKQNEELVPEF